MTYLLNQFGSRHINASAKQEFLFEFLFHAIFVRSLRPRAVVISRKLPRLRASHEIAETARRRHRDLMWPAPVYSGAG
jgi:hypothetical protein